MNTTPQNTPELRPDSQSPPGHNLLQEQPPAQSAAKAPVLPKTSGPPLAIKGAPKPPSILRHLPPEATPEQVEEIGKGMQELTGILAAPLTPDRPAEVALREVQQFVNKDEHNAYAALHEGFLRHGVTLGTVENGGSPIKRTITAQTSVQYREALIREYNLTTTAEFMLLDMAMIAYSRAMLFDHMAGHFGQGANVEQTYAYGDIDLKRVAKIAEMAGRYRAEFRACLKALQEIKAPPFTVKIGNAEKVGIMVAGNSNSPGERESP